MDLLSGDFHDTSYDILMFFQVRSLYKWDVVYIYT